MSEGANQSQSECSMKSKGLFKSRLKVTHQSLSWLASPSKRWKRSALHLKSHRSLATYEPSGSLVQPLGLFSPSLSRLCHTFALLPGPSLPVATVAQLGVLPQLTRRTQDPLCSDFTRSSWHPLRQRWRPPLALQHISTRTIERQQGAAVNNW